MDAYRRYPGFKQTKISRPLDVHLENLDLRGYSIMEGVLSRDKAQEIARDLDRVWRKQEEEFGRERLIQLGELGTCRGLLAEHPRYADIVVEPKVLEVVRAILGDGAILHLQNGSAAFPKVEHFQSTLHRDFAKDVVSSKPVSINAFWCISDFRKENGATLVLPYSHKIEQFPSAEYIEKNLVSIEAPAGSVLFFDSLLLHKTGYNGTETVRYGINNQYTRPYLKQQIDYPVYLRDRYPIESEIGQVLGFWSIPPKSVQEYRVDPDKRTYRRNQG